MEYTKDEKIVILGELVLMAHADHVLKKEEVSFLTAVAQRLDINASILQDMIKHPEKLSISVPKNFSKRILHFHRLMLMMHIDNHIDDLELELLYDTALRYGIRKPTVDHLLKVMQQYPHGEIPPSELLAIHQSDLN